MGVAIGYMEAMQDVKDWAQLLLWAASIAAAVYGVFNGLRQWRENTNQRQADLRWKQANKTHELLTQIHASEHAKHAITMLDWFACSHDYEIEKDKPKLAISYEEVLAALRKEQRELEDGKELFIFDSFDWFFYYVDRIEHYIRRGLVTFEDVEAVFLPYAKKIAKHRRVYEAFLRSRDYDLAVGFWGRYNCWQSAE